MTFAGTLLLLDLLLVARMLLRRERLPGHGPTAWLDRPWLAWAVLLTISLALIVSLTRSAWLALAGALALAAAHARPRLLAAAVPLAAVFLVLAPVPVVHRLLSISSVGEESNYDRIVMAEAGLRMIAERPLLGVGPDMVRRYWAVYRDPSAPRLITPHLHDAYIELAAERGLPALATYLALVACAAAAAWRGFRRERAAGDGTADLHLGVLVALAGFSIAALFENNWGDVEVQRLVLFLLAVPFCLEAGDSAAAPAAGGAA
jgi:O-antigen ligase